MPEILSESQTSTGKCTGSYQVIKNKHTKDWISSRLYTCAQRTVSSSSVGMANTEDNNSGLF
ncbi:hypothetical protein PIB30_032587 [Stylosanthes scabra]|uniref:Uncharacterized protein n=1 Tax=Stylosanthes scabra TaxID=79078 RepID=A0ABU6SCE6_9FABA|nr:hypothetical protein [Stylosanthes scabra]